MAVTVTVTVTAYRDRGSYCDLDRNRDRDRHCDSDRYYDRDHELLWRCSFIYKMFACMYSFRKMQYKKIAHTLRHVIWCVCT